MKTLYAFPTKNSDNGKMVASVSLPKKIPDARMDSRHSPLFLLHQLLQVSTDIYNEEIGAAGITARQFAVLQAIENTDGISQSQLGKAAGIDRSTLAELVARMVRKGLLRRESSRVDGRINLIWLDVGGRVALQALRPHVAAANTRIVGLISQPEYAEFVGWLRAAGPAPKEGGDQKDQGAGGDLSSTEMRSRAKKEKPAKTHKNLPMPPLSMGAIPETPEDRGDRERPSQWRAPKPIWNG